MNVHLRGAARFLLVTCVAATVLLPTSALAKRAANYAYDWYAYPYENIDLYDAAGVAAFWQQSMGYTTMSRDYGTGKNIYDKLAGTDPNTYQVINVVTHSDPNHINARPPNSYGYMSCLYQRPTSGEYLHMDGVMNLRTGQPVENWSVERGRIQSLTSVPSVTWILFQGCDTAGYGEPSEASCAFQACIEGVDTSTGFTECVSIDDFGTSGHTYEWDFANGYWCSLYWGGHNSEALYAGAAAVNVSQGDHGGYDSWCIFGTDAMLNPR